MKQLALFLFLLLGCHGFSHSQAVLTYATTNPVVTDHFVIYSCDTAYSESYGGAGVVWNFSLPTIYWSDSTSFLDCDSSLHCDYFPGSNIVERITHNQPSTIHDPIQYYYQQSTDSLVYRGTAWFLGPDISYTDPAVRFKYPFTYNTYITDSFAINHPTATWLYKGSDTIHCDGYGTLIFPGITLYNVLRIYQKHIEWDSTWTTVGPTPRYTESRSYTWYMPDYHYYLLYISYDSVSYSHLPGTTSKSVKYSIKYIPDRVPTVQTTGTGLLVYPNPVTNIITFQINSDKAEPIQIELIDIFGRLTIHRDMTIDAGTQTVDLPVEGLTRGLYFVKVSSTRGTLIRKVELY